MGEKKDKKELKGNREIGDKPVKYGTGKEIEKFDCHSQFLYNGVRITK
jgi:hypothetical protein